MPSVYFSENVGGTPLSPEGAELLIKEIEQYLVK
ncbi:hypothetical protein [Bacillus thuringiensis]